MPALLKLKEEGVGLVVTVDCGAGAVEALTAARDAGLDVDRAGSSCGRAPSRPPSRMSIPTSRATTRGSAMYAPRASPICFSSRSIARFARRALRARCASPNCCARSISSVWRRCAMSCRSSASTAPSCGGLARLSKLERPGLAALARVAGATPPFTPYHLGFVFGPRINAGGRVGRCSLGVDLLTAKTAAEADEYAEALDTHNRERQAIEKLILEEAIAQAALQDNAPFLFVAGEGWHPGVVGIVAGRLKERFGKPAFVGGLRRRHGTRLGALDGGRRYRRRRARGARRGRARRRRRPCHGGGIFACGPNRPSRSAPS